MGPRRKRHRWKIDSDNQFVRLKICVAVGCVSGQTMKIAYRNLALTIRAPHAHDRFERGKRDAHVARVRGDAVFALAENGVNAVVAVDRAASASRLALIARRKCRIVKVVAARALQKISTDG